MVTQPMAFAIRLCRLVAQTLQRSQRRPLHPAALAFTVQEAVLEAILCKSSQQRLPCATRRKTPAIGFIVT